MLDEGQAQYDEGVDNTADQQDFWPINSAAGKHGSGGSMSWSELQC